MNRIINQILKTALNELFIDALKDTVHLSLGDDLFSSSKIHLQNLTLRSDIFNSIFFPFQLISGHLGNLLIEGLAEIALGGGTGIKISIDNVFLLFSFHSQSLSQLNLLTIQILKKIFLELISKAVTHSLIKNLLKKLLGMKLNQNLKTDSQRKLIFFTIKYLFKVIQIQIKKIHVRMEFQSSSSLQLKKNLTGETMGGGEESYSAIGMSPPPPSPPD
jgi:hypothetical protein